VILNVFRTGINAVSFLPAFLSCVLGVLNSPMSTPAQGLLGLAREHECDYDLYGRTRACLLGIFVPPPTNGPISLSC